MNPISPSEIEEVRTASIPDFVFETINGLLKKNAGQMPTIRLEQSEIVDAILASNIYVTRDEIFSRHYLDFEAHYRKAGWDVEYEKDSMVFGGTGRPTFTFYAR